MSCCLLMSGMYAVTRFVWRLTELRHLSDLSFFMETPLFHSLALVLGPSLPHHIPFHLCFL